MVFPVVYYLKPLNYLVNLNLVKELRARTGCGIVECQTALTETKNDIAAAITLLRKKGILKAAKKADRLAGEGVVASYIHGHKKLGVLVALRCETDFVARNDKFQELARNIALHIAAADPIAVSPGDIDSVLIEAEREITLDQLKNSDKSAAIKDKIVAGKLKTFTEERALLTQVYVKDTSIIVQDLIAAAVQELGENITVSSFSRLSI